MSVNKGNGEAGQSPLVERSERVEELMLAGIGLSERDSRKNPKKFQKAVKRGRKAERASHTYTGVLARLHAAAPVYVRPGAGGWHEVWVRDVRVDKVQGEDAALRRMAELTLEYIQVDEARRAAPTGMRAGGAGWYDLIAHGVVVDRVQGEQEAHTRVEELRGTTRIES
jgi:hypothetical protein